MPGAYKFHPDDRRRSSADARWLEMPHIKEWWGEQDEEISSNCCCLLHLATLRIDHHYKRVDRHQVVFMIFSQSLTD